MENKQPKIIILSGPSGSGKGSVIGMLPANYIKAVSATTRGKRDGEIHGVDYTFMTHEHFKTLIDQDGILEYNFYDGNYYGTPRSEITDNLARGLNVVLDVDVNGAYNIKRAFPEAVMVFIIPPNAIIQRDRLRGRKTNSEESIASRMKLARKELPCAADFDCIIVNETGRCEEAVKTLMDAVEGHYPDRTVAEEAIAHYFDQYED